MAYEQAYENGRSLPVRVTPGGVTVPRARTSGTGERREAIRGLWSARGDVSLISRIRGLSARSRRLILCAALGVCLLIACVCLAVRGLTGGQSGADRGSLPGVLGSLASTGTKGDTEPSADADTHIFETDPGSVETAPAVEPVDTSVLNDETSVGTMPERGTEPVTESDTEPASDTGADTPPDAEPETQPPVPVAGEGAVLRDMSESERGADYLLNDTDRDPAAVPAWVPDGTKKPVVLLVCSRPYDGYADGDAGGVVSDLADALAAALRSRGVTVICVNRALTGLTKDSSLSACREKTQSLIRYYCRLYGDITLVMDVRRGAELVEGSLLATAGTADGQPSAQLRLIADGRRPGDENGTADADLDLSLAAAIRRGVYEVSPTASRPVLWRDNAGLIPGGLCEGAAGSGGSGPRLVTVELGSAGNTYSSAAALIPLLARSTAAALGQ